MRIRIVELRRFLFPTQSVKTKNRLILRPELLMKPVNLFIVFMLLVSGCASKIAYEVDKSLYVNTKQMNYNVVVYLFEDKRPEEEHSGIWMDKAGNKQKGIAYTADKHFNDNVAKQITETIVTHIKEANLFNKIELRDVDEQKDIETLNKEGIDIVIVGKLEHFYGFQFSSPMAGIFGVVGLLVEVAGAEASSKKNVGAYVAFNNIKVIDVKHNNILWEGTVEDKFEEKDPWYDGSVAYALRSLKQVNDKFVKELEKIIAQASSVIMQTY